MSFQARDNSNSPKLGLAFSVKRMSPDNKRENPYQVQFVFDKDNKLIKLGEGSYGSVFRGFANQEECAIKVWYEGSTSTPRALSQLPETDITTLISCIVNGLGCTSTEAETIVKSNLADPDRLMIELVQLAFGNAPKRAHAKLTKTIQSIRQLVDSEAGDRFRSERDSTVTLLTAQNQLQGIVRVLGGTDMFNDVVARDSELAEQFSSLQVSPSQFALVMERYSYSLKDLLEKKPHELNKLLPPDQHVKGDKPGYSKLKSMKFRLRTREALLLLQDVVIGLSLLHGTRSPYDNTQQFLHRDVKPGNIYIRSYRGSVSTVLGDLGNLPRKPTPLGVNLNASMLAEKGMTIEAPGTPGYRSPEQKYHYLVVYANVSIENDVVKLTIDDPKIAEGLFEPGDYVIVSKAKSKAAIVIRSLVQLPGSAPEIPGPTVVSVAVSEHSGLFSQGDRLQIELHKQQGERTDIFGIGAVFFDIVTCGSSPETFYEGIRRFEGGSIKDIVSNYSNMRVGGSERYDPDLERIFAPFRERNDRLDPTVVEFILKCMLYKANGTFYNEAQSERPVISDVDIPGDELGSLGAGMDISARPSDKVPSISKLIDFLTHKETGLYRKYLDADRVPHVISGDTGSADEPVSISLSEEIGRLQQPNMGIAVPNSAEQGLAQREARRLIRGGFDFLQLLIAVSEHLTVEIKGDLDYAAKGKNAFLYQLNPERITYEINHANVASISFEGVEKYATMNDYIADSKTGFRRLVKYASNPFVPRWLADMKRSVLIWPKKLDSNQSLFQVRPVDAARFCLPLQEKDWIAIGQGVVQVESLREDMLVKLPDISQYTGSNATGPWSADRYTYLEPFRYYLDMLAIYVQQFIFTHSAFTTTTSDHIDVASIFPIRRGSDDVVIVLPDSIGRDRSNVSAILDSYLYLFLRLCAHDAANSCYSEHRNKGRNAQEILGQVIQYAEHLYKRTCKLFGVRPSATQDTMPAEIVDDDVKLEIGQVKLPEAGARYSVEERIAAGGYLWKSNDNHLAE